jgi:hypothetical protein
MTKYTKKQNTDGIEFIVRDNEDGTESWIPKNEYNSDYQVYLKSLEAEQSTPSVNNAD